MATLIEKWHARRADSNLAKQVESAVFAAAYDVRNEDALTPNHATRLAWALAVRDLDGVELEKSVKQGLMACLDNPTIGGNPDAATDNDVQFVINSAVNDLAGVEA